MCKWCEQTNKSLQESLTTLKLMQKRLVQSEKMASLGQLTAGIAHEINNPVNFVIANVKPLHNDLQDILNIINEYEKAINSNDLKSKFSDVEKLKVNLEYSTLLKEIENLLKGIEEGGRRTAEIVKGLRNFSRLDEDEMKLANINEGIESTLLMLKNDFKNRIEIHKEYGDIPDILCFPGKLNQVFMNILSNAGQAIENEGRIDIRTFTNKEKVLISFKDTGCGMDEETINKIFDPFFTTKDVGRGTGLGLSISYGIIKDHNGDIEVKSEINEGTEFIIILPLKQ